MSTDNHDANKENQHAIKRLKAHRALTAAQGLVSISENLQNTIYDNPELIVDSEELDAINDEIVKLQERAIGVIKVIKS